MSLLDVAKNGVETAFQAAGSFVSLATYYSRTGSTVYDPVTDVLTAPVTTLTNVRMIRTAATAQEREASPVGVNDVKVLIPATDLPGIEPADTDEFEMEGARYNVLTFKAVTKDILWVVFARAK